MQKDIHFETLTIDDAMDFSFHYNSNVNVALSIHTENEIIYLLSGDLFLLVNEETYHMKPGDIALINAFEPHEILKGNEPGYQYDLQYDPFSIFRGMNPKKGKKFSDRILNDSFGEVYHTAVEYMELLYRELLEEDLRELSSLSVLGMLYVHLCRHLPCEDYGPSVFVSQDEVDRHQDVINYILKNYSEPITLEDAARVANFSVYHFSRFFRKMSGTTFVNYVNSIRLHKAESMLIRTDKQISEISYDCGFASVKTFNRIFQQNNGMSPREYKYAAKSGLLTARNQKLAQEKKTVRDAEEEDE